MPGKGPKGPTTGLQMTLANQLHLLASVTLASLTEHFEDWVVTKITSGVWKNTEFLCYEFTCRRENMNAQGCPVQKCRLFPVGGVWPPYSAYQTGSVYPTYQTIALMWGCGRHAFSVSLLALADGGRVCTRRGKQALCLFSNGLLLGS